MNLLILVVELFACVCVFCLYARKEITCNNHYLSKSLSSKLVFFFLTSTKIFFVHVRNATFTVLACAMAAKTDLASWEHNIGMGVSCSLHRNEPHDKCAQL